MGVFGDMRKETFAASVAALILLLLLYFELYRWEGVHLVMTAYEPAQIPYVATNFSAPGQSIRQRMRQIIESSQEQMLRGGRRSDVQKCPDWYNIIREDFQPWSDRQGITPAALFNAWPLAHFRFQIVDGELYVERNWQMMQYKYMEYLRFYYSVWGILQLLERYPGQVPDVDVMVETFDHPLVDKYQWEMDMDPPPLLKYCGTPNHWDITWPDWSFWGWAELEIPPWQLQLDAIVQTNKTDWEKRPGHAFWQGGSEQCLARQELWKCEDNEKLRWGVELRHVDWGEGLVDNKLLENQCQHKFKLYMEGWAWSASGKYILACDATTLMVESEWFEFWYRGLKPGVNFLPVAKAPNLCANIRKTVDWGRAHPRVAKQIGRAGTEFLMREVNMPLVYDYMLHVLREYASLQTFKVQPSQYALKVTTKTWLKDAFDERNSESDLPRGLRYFPEVLRPGIPPKKVRAQLLVEDRAERPPCVVDWGQPERPSLDPRDTVGSIPAGLLREFEELAVREEEDRRVAEEREREDARAREETEKAAQEREKVLAREREKEGRGRSGREGLKGEREELRGAAQATESSGGSLGEQGGKLLGDKILGELGRGDGTTEVEARSVDIELTVKPLTFDDLPGTGNSRLEQATGTVEDQVVESGSEGFDVRLKKRSAPGKGG